MGGLIVLFPFVLFAGFFFLIVLGIMSGIRQTTERRNALDSRIEQLVLEQQWLIENASLVDDKTAERIRLACAAVRDKIQQAIDISQRARERDFARAHRILDQAQTKLANSRAGMERALQRAQERDERRIAAEQRRFASEQRRAEAEQRRAQMEERRTRSGSFAATGRMSSATTDWNTVSRSERGVCFFCGRPVFLWELTPVTVTLNGRTQRVLACLRDLMTVRSGATPPVRAFVVEHHYVPWYAYPQYNPYRDYYAGGYADGLLTADLYDAALIAPQYWDWRDNAVMPDGNYVFSPDSEGYQDFYSSEAASHADYDPMQNVGGANFDLGQNTGGVDFAGGQGSDFAGNSGNAPGDFTDPNGGDFADNAGDYDQS